MSEVFEVYSVKDAERLSFREKTLGVVFIVLGGDRWREGNDAGR